MELPSRPKNDRYTRPGQYKEIERRLRANPANARIPIVVAYAFDLRTRLGPFLFADTRLLTAGPRAIAARRRHVIDFVMAALRPQPHSNGRAARHG